MTKKNQIMMALFNCEGLNLTSKDILWIESYLPDSSDEPGSYSTNPLLDITYNHKCQNVNDSIGIKDFDKSRSEIIDIIANEDLISKALEKVIKNNDPDMLKILLVQGMIALRIQGSSHDVEDSIRGLLKFVSGRSFKEEKPTKVKSAVITNFDDLKKILEDSDTPSKVKLELLKAIVGTIRRKRDLVEDEDKKHFDEMLKQIDDALNDLEKGDD